MHLLRMLSFLVTKVWHHNMGVWKHNAIDSNHVSVSFSEGHVEAVKKHNSIISPCGKIYSVKCVHCTH